MPRLARSSFLATVLLVVSSIPGSAGDGAVGVRVPASPSVIVIGFVGGFVRHDNPRHGPVLLAGRIKNSVPKDAYVQVFENRHRRSAYATILRLLDENHDGALSTDEKSRARIILYGHSWGASAVVMLARELNRMAIPVLLTVQVDSVRKLWQHDGVIPENVMSAVNFYQPHGLVHGRTAITAADPLKTQILGNYRFDYSVTPVKCGGGSWFDHIVPSHAQSECDPSLWGQVETLVEERVQPQTSVARNPSIQSVSSAP